MRGVRIPNCPQPSYETQIKFSAYRSNRSIEDAISLSLHYALEHLDKINTYARILFIDFSSAFNTISPHKLFFKLQDMNINPAINYWILDFLSNRTQTVKINNLMSHSLSLSTGAPQGCVLSPWLFSLFTNQLTSLDKSVKIFKYADDTTILGLIKNNNETIYRREVERVASWCSLNNLLLNTDKTIEIAIDFRTTYKTLKSPLTISDQPITLTDSFKFLGTHISNNLTWEHNITTICKKAQQRLYFLRQLRKYRVQQRLLLRFYFAIIQSIISSSITVWYGSADQHSKSKLQRIIKKAAKIIGSDLPSLDSIYTSRTITRATKIIKDPSHPAHSPFEL